jgi:HEAT repeat protein
VRRLRLGAHLVLLAFVTAVALTGGPATGETADLAKDLKSRDVEKRLAAVETLRKDGGEAAGALLREALEDHDWEVVEKAVVALAERGGPESVKRLVDLAVAGPVRRIRLAAAATLAKLDPWGAAKALAKDLRGEEAVRAADALAVIARRAGAPPAEDDTLAKGVERALKSKEGPVRAAAAPAFRSVPEKARAEWPARLFDDADYAVPCALLDEMRREPRVEDLAFLLERLAKPDLNDVVERRLLAALVAGYAALLEEDAAARLEAVGAVLQTTKSPAAAGRTARLLGRLGAAPPPAPAPTPEPKKDEPKKEETPPTPAPAPDAKPPAAEKPAVRAPVVAPDRVLAALRPALDHKDDGVRASAVQALGSLRTPAALDEAVARGGDGAARVRIQVLRAVVAGRGLTDAATLALVAEKLEKDKDATVREEAAVLLGVSGPERAPFDAPVAALAKATQDESWAVAVVAAVSLGKTRSTSAVEPLVRMLDTKEVKDWRRRGAAVVGLGTMQIKEAVAGVIKGLEDKDPYVRKTAFEYLRRMTSRNIDPEANPWTAWWERQAPGYEFVDRDKEAREAKKGGYAVKPVDVYDKVGTAEMDVVVLQSRGDHIEKLLTKLNIKHRITRAASVAEAELHPFAVFVSNCTGEVQEEDVARLQWFVRVGGYLFCSCWALKHTAELVYPGLVQKLTTKAQVVDTVIAEPCQVESPFFEGVFPAFTRPLYNLEGAHLIEVLQPERIEVLIDSPPCATRWGGGNLACWFPVGHGVLLDSVNHFDNQGFKNVRGLKTAQDRMAHAVDHMGLDYADIRPLTAAKVWDSATDSNEEARDLSAFRFITNFVRQKRRVSP